MTKLLEKAIEEVRKLPDAEQDEWARFILDATTNTNEPVKLDETTRAAVHRGLSEMHEGKFATDEEVAAVYRRHRS